MRVDHVSYAAEWDGLRATARRLGQAIGVEPVFGGVHPRFGTRNAILPLADHRYVEVVEVLDHPASDKAPFGQAVRARSEVGGGWFAWVVAVEDIGAVGQRLGRESYEGFRRRPDGVDLRWRQLGVKGLLLDPQLPYFTQWADPTLHPCHDGPSDARLHGLEIAGDRGRVLDWLGLPVHQVAPTLELSFVAPHGSPGLLTVTFQTPSGLVTV
ncbi:MAG TPA: VOC family protein [Dermatophilaceae bacterium]|nr:VOC family protein [Dermatophilaceae bacterium]